MSRTLPLIVGTLAIWVNTYISLKRKLNKEGL